MAGSFKEHIQTAVSTVGVAVVLWAGMAINASQQSGVAITVELQHIKSDLSDIKAELATQATRGDDKLKTLEKRVWALEVRNRALIPVRL